MAPRNTGASIRPPLLPLLTFLLSLSLSLFPLFPLAASKSPHLPAALRRARLRRSGGGPVITYHGGPVLGRTGPVTVYLVYYGNWGTQSGRTQQKLISTFVKSLSGDSGPQGDGGVPTVKQWWASVTQYYGEDSQGKKYQVNPNVRLGRIVFDKYSLGKKWTNDSKSVWAAVAKQLDARRFPVDKEGIYVVLTSPDMNVKGVCSDFCGWHDKQYYGDTVLAYSIVTDASKCPDTCGYNSPAAPGRTRGMEGTVDTLGHELMEAVTDPDVTYGWFTDSKAFAEDNENGDMCEGGGTPKQARTSGPNGEYKYNVVGLDNTPFALQLVFSRVTQSCVIQAQYKTKARAPLALAPDAGGPLGAPADSPASLSPSTVTTASAPYVVTPSTAVMAPATVTPMGGNGAGVTIPPVEAPVDASSAPPCSYVEVGPTEGPGLPTSGTPGANAPTVGRTPPPTSSAGVTDHKAFFVYTVSASVGALLLLLA